MVLYTEIRFRFIVRSKRHRCNVREFIIPPSQKSNVFVCHSSDKSKNKKTENGPIRQIRNFDQKSKFWSKIEILIENRNFGQKSKFWSKIKILVKNRNFGQKSKFWSKIEILARNWNYGQKSEFWPEVVILVKNLAENKKCLSKTTYFQPYFPKEMAVKNGAVKRTTLCIQYFSPVPSKIEHQEVDVDYDYDSLY